MSEGTHTNILDYKRFVYSGRRSWWNPVYKLGNTSGRMTRAMALVKQDLEGIIGKKIV
tara:strand:+ start:38 stop:211 length:174 start_codon:yes stop_codon:yes gene_type:complete